LPLPHRLLRWAQDEAFLRQALLLSQAETTRVPPPLAHRPPRLAYYQGGDNEEKMEVDEEMRYRQSLREYHQQDADSSLDGVEPVL
jgi:hypothetical protein